MYIYIYWYKIWSTSSYLTILPCIKIFCTNIYNNKMADKWYV